MAGERTFVVKILGDAGSAVAAFKKLQTEGEKATGALGIQSKQLEGIFKQVTIAAAAGFASGVALMTSSVSAAIQAQAEQTRLAEVLRTTVDASDAQIESLNFQAEALQRIGVVSAGTTSVVQSQLATFDLSVDTIRRLTPAVLDYVTAEKGATASTEDFKSMTNGLAQALQGNFASLTKSGFVLDANTKELIKSGTESQRAAALVQVLNSTYEGFNETLRDTPQGQMQALKNSVNDLQTSFGQLLLPALAAILPLFQSLADLAQRHSTIFAGLVITFTAVAGAVLLYAAYLKLLPLRIAAVAAAQAILNFVMTANPLGLLIVAIGALVTAFVVLTGNMDKVIAKTIEMVNSFNKLVNLLLPDMLEIPMMKVAKATKAIADENYRSIPLAEQIGQKYLEIAGACREILNVPIAKQLQTQTDRLTGLARSLGVTYVSYGQFNKATGGASKAVETAAEKMKKYTDAVKSSTAAQKSFTSAQKDTAKAADSLKGAQDDVFAKQKALNDAVNGFGADSDQAKKAQRELAQAERNVAEAGFRVEESVFAVRDAEKKLADLRKDPTASAQEIRLAEIDLAKAKLAVADATDSEFDATNKLKDAQLILNEAVDGAIVGSDTYNKLLEDVFDAKEKEREASERLTDAVDRETEAYERLAEAIKTASDAAKNTGRTGLVIPALPTVPQPTSTTVPSDIRGGGGANITINTGIGTNGIEAGRQIVQLLQQYTAVDAFAIDRLNFAPRR
jgi:uncharacterized coiled-coil DUF342 family protein